MPAYTTARKQALTIRHSFAVPVPSDGHLQATEIIFCVSFSERNSRRLTFCLI